ncbi:hypothetical protein [Paludisphaera rhizosphaerae]|uniref:hypothetical protein n=1 Tax=Paludisphaera rhizosphaerae TaxID=2711216 RepID=UPI0013EB326D|nr:hypothetical protein [Paludisphaera rhizosphaerae]
MNTAPPRSDDDARTRSDDPEPARPTRPRKPIPPDSRTSDEINAMLSSSLEKPEPDPMLGGSSSVDLQEDAKRKPGVTHPSDGLDFDVRVASSSDEVSSDSHPRSRSDLGNVLLKSYASAVTLALIWVLWTGRTARPPDAATSQRETPSRRRVVDVDPPAAVEAPVVPAEAKTTPLRKPIVVGDLEITPLTILWKDVQVSRKQQGKAARIVNARNCLVLTLRIKNLSTEQTLTPLTSQDLWNTASFAIEAPQGPPIAMYTTGSRAEWTIDEQSFRSIEPGGVVDVSLVSEPMPSDRLTTGMTWRFRIATDPERSEKANVAVSFDRDDVHDGS